MPFELVPHIGTGLALAAFIGALAAWLLRRKLVERERLIRVAPAESRSKLVDSALEWFNIDTATLTPDQKYSLALRQIQSRERRLAAVIGSVLLVAVMSASLAAYSIRLSPDITPDAHKHAVALGIWPTAPGPTGARFNVYINGRHAGTLDNRDRPETLDLGLLGAGLHEFHFDQIVGYNIDERGGATSYVQNLSCGGSFRVGRDGVYRVSISYWGEERIECRVTE